MTYFEGKGWITFDPRLATLLQRLDRLEAVAESDGSESDAAIVSRMEDVTVLIDVIGWDLKEILDQYGIGSGNQNRLLMQSQMKTIADNAVLEPSGDALRRRLGIIWCKSGGLKFNLKQIQAT